MPTAGVSIRTSQLAIAAYWREVLFWLLLLLSFSALGSARPGRQLAGLAVACGFLFLAILSIGRLRALGLEYMAWEAISWRPAAMCAAYGALAGAAIVGIANIVRAASRC